MQVQEFEARLISSCERENLQKNGAKTQQLSHTQLRGPAFSLNKSPTELCWGGSSALLHEVSVVTNQGTTELMIWWNRSQALAAESKELPRLWAPSSSWVDPPWSSTSQSRILSQEEHLIQNKSEFHFAFVTELQYISYPYFFPPTGTFYLSLLIFQAITTSITPKIFQKIGAGSLEKESLRFLCKLWKPLSSSILFTTWEFTKAGPDSLFYSKIILQPQDEKSKNSFLRDAKEKNGIRSYLRKGQSCSRQPHAAC